MLNGEKWFVTSEGDPGFYLVLAVADGEQALFIVEPWRPGLNIAKTPAFPPRPLPRPSPGDHAHQRARSRREPHPGRWRGRRTRVSSSSASSSQRCCGAAQRSLELAREYALERGLRCEDRRAPGLLPASRLADRVARPPPHLSRGGCLRLEAARVVHGKVAMAKLYLRGSRPHRRPRPPGARRAGLHAGEPGGASTARSVDRIWEGTSEIQRLIVSRGLLKRGVEPSALSPSRRRPTWPTTSLVDSLGSDPKGLDEMWPTRSSLRPRAGSPGGCAPSRETIGHVGSDPDMSRSRHVQVGGLRLEARLADR